MAKIEKNAFKNGFITVPVITQTCNLDKKKLATAWLWASLFCILPGSSLWAIGQGWMVSSINLKAANKVSILAIQENRFRTFTYFNNHYLANYQLIVVYKFGADFYGAIGYRRQDEDKHDYTSHENRFFIEGGWKTDLQHDLTFDTRLMVESRYYEQEFLEHFFRYRARFRLTYLMHIGSVKLTPFMGSEIFCDARETSVTFLNRHRLYIGADFPANKRMLFNVYYMQQVEKNRSSLTALVAGFLLKI